MKKIKRLICVISAITIMFSTFIPFAKAETNQTDNVVSEKLLNLDFDTIDDASSVLGLIPEKSWVSYASSQLTYIQDGSDYILRFPLSEAMDLESDNKYEIELRARIPYNNYRLMALSNGDTGTTGLYAAMASGMLTLCRYSFPASEQSDLSIDDKSGIGSATSNEWRTIKLTYDKGNITLDVTDEKGTGNVSSTSTITLSSITGSGNFKHRPRTTYDHILLGHLERDKRLELDYIRVTKTYSAQTDDEEDPVEPETPVDGLIADFEFDGQDDADKIIIGQYSLDYDWVRYASSQLAMLTNPYEQPVYLTLNEGIDLASDNIYEIEMRLKAPIDNFYCAALTNDINSGAGVMYSVIYNNLQLISTANGVDANSKKVQLAQTSQPIGSATSSEWKTLKYTFSKDFYELEATVERATGNVTSVTSGTLASITAATATGGKHVSGKVYNHIALANTYSSSEMTVDYVRVTKKAADEQNPWVPREYNDPDNVVVEPDVPDEPTGTIIGTIADFEFDGQDASEKIIIGANSSAYDWVRYASSELALKTNPFEECVHLKLDDEIDLSSELIYEIEMRLKSPIDNYRFVSLTNGVNNAPGSMYTVMYNNFLLGSTADGVNSNSKKIQLSQLTDPIASATSSEWRTLKYTLTKDYYQLNATVERATGNVSSVVSGPLSAITGTAAGGGKHVSGKVYDHIALANTYSTSEMTVDYVKVIAKEPDAENPWTPSEFYDPDDTTVRTPITQVGKVRFIGRGEITEAGEKTLNWSSAGFEFKFSGTKAEIFVSDAAGKSYFNVWVDNGTPTRMALNAGWNTLAESLDGTTEHTIKVRRSSSAQHGTLKVQTIRTDAEISATQAPDKLIEFIGDSYTTGYGNLGGVSESSETTDSRQSYAGYVAEKLGAEESLIAYAGRGIVKGYSPDSTYEMPVQFGLEEIFMDWGGAGRNMSSGQAHNFNDYQPQYVVLWLGTNDFANNVDAATFAAKYEEFLEDIRTAYPDAVVLCMTRASTGYPTEVAQAVANMGGKEARFYYEAIDNFSASSIGHPSVAEAAIIGEEVYARLVSIEEELQIWGSEEDPVIPEVSVEAYKLVKGEEEITEVSELAKNDSVTVSLDYYNTTGEDASYTVIAVYFGENDKLINAEVVKSETVDKDITSEIKTFNMTVGDLTDVAKISFFVWDSLAGMTPLGEAFPI